MITLYLPKASETKWRGLKVSVFESYVIAGLNSSDILVFYFLYIICCYWRWNHSSLLPNLNGAIRIIYSEFYRLFQVFRIVSNVGIISLIPHTREQLLSGSFILRDTEERWQYLIFCAEAAGAHFLMMSTGANLVSLLSNLMMVLLCKHRYGQLKSCEMLE